MGLVSGLGEKKNLELHYLNFIVWETVASHVNGSVQLLLGVAQVPVQLPQLVVQAVVLLAALLPQLLWIKIKKA